MLFSMILMIMTQTRAQGIMVAMLAVPPVDTGAPITSREQPPPLTGSQCLHLYLTKSNYAKKALLTSEKGGL
jgi:hypothetical protein